MRQGGAVNGEMMEGRFVGLLLADEGKGDESKLITVRHS